MEQTLSLLAAWYGSSRFLVLACCGSTRWVTSPQNNDSIIQNLDIASRTEDDVLSAVDGDDFVICSGGCSS